MGRSGLALGASDWLLVDQARIDAFAEATGDRQWIHVDPERAKAGPFGATIAHGYLTLSLLPVLMFQVLQVRGVTMAVNAGCDRLRFLNPVKAGARIRAHGELLSAEEVQGSVRVLVRATVEIEGQDKPALVAELVSRQFPQI